MQEQEDIFTISVEINRGLEPLTLSVLAYQDTSVNIDHRLSFEVSKDKEILGVLFKDSHQHWRQLEGSMDQDMVDGIGAAIDASYLRERL